LSHATPPHNYNDFDFDNDFAGRECDVIKKPLIGVLCYKFTTESTTLHVKKFENRSVAKLQTTE